MTQTVISVDHVVQNYGKSVVLHNVDLTVEKGEIIGFLGPSGSGKTTLVKTIVGMNRPKNGSVTVHGVTMPSLEAVKSIGYMAQSDALYEDLSGMENLMFFARLYGMNRKEARQNAIRVLELTELHLDAKKAVKFYSGGMKRRLSLCIAMIHNPDLLILDEPTVGIDPVLRNIFWKEFKRLSSLGTTILITTHVMDEAEHCDRLAFIRNGEITAVGHPEGLKILSGQDTIEGAFLYYGGNGEAIS